MNLTPEKVRGLDMIAVQKPEENLEATLIPSRKESLSIMTDSGETSSQAFNTETRLEATCAKGCRGP